MKSFIITKLITKPKVKARSLKINEKLSYYVNNNKLSKTSENTKDTQQLIYKALVWQTNKELYSWLSNQLNNSTKREYIMKSDIIYQEWNNFITDARYKKYFQSNEEDWKNKLEEVKMFIDLNNSRPTPKTNKELCNWLSTQLKNYKKMEYIMKDPEIRKLWEDFTTEYSQYFT